MAMTGEWASQASRRAAARLSAPINCAMHMQPLDLGAPLHLGVSGAQHGGHVEHMGDAIALEHVGEALRPGHFAVVADLHVLVFLTEELFPGAAQHEMLRCRPGIVTHSEPGAIPDQRCTTSCCTASGKR